MAVDELAPRLGLFDATMVVMGGIVGSGIFINPAVVARQVHGAPLILGAWIAGGAIALLGAFIYAELAARLPRTGGQYAYLREAIHPMAGFLYGWVLLLVINAGGIAAVSVTFARYFVELTGWQIHEGIVAAGALAAFTLINCLGVQSGSAAQSGLMVLKIAVIAALVICGALFAPAARAQPIAEQAVSFDLISSFGAALVPVLFAYGGWQTANFIAGEVREPRRNMPRALLIGVIGVIALYFAVNWIAVRALGPEGLAASATPASAVMRLALGARGGNLIAAGIAISALGFLGQSVLTAPRVYFAMAKDGLFFQSVAWVHPRTRAPVVAIALQGAVSMVVALSGRYEQILSYVVAMDWIFFGLTAACLFVLRRRGGGAASKVPGHPYTTALFVLAAALVVLNTLYRYPINTLLGVGIGLCGIPAYLMWKRRITG